MGYTMLRKSPFRCFGRFVSGMANLSDLPYEMLAEIARRLKKLEDYISFRSVSKSLRAAAKDEYFEGLRLRQQTPYLMLSVRNDGNDDIREIYSLVEGELVISSVKVPKFKGKKWTVLTSLKSKLRRLIYLMQRLHNLQCRRR